MKVPTDWWRNFFSGLTLDLWRAAAGPEWTQAECDAITKMLDVKPGQRLLDVPCGFGRHACELARRGFEVVGVDFSPECIAEACERAGGTEGTVRFERRDMRDLPWSQAFDGAYCFGNSFGYMDDEANEAFIQAFAHTLRPGARAAFGTTCLECILGRFQPREWSAFGGITMLEENRYEWQTSRFETDYTFIRGSRVEHRSGSQRLYTYRELVGLLERHALKVIGSYSSAALEPFALPSSQLLLAVAKES